jgi:hypothetical protein
MEVPLGVDDSGTAGAEPEPSPHAANARTLVITIMIFMTTF